MIALPARAIVRFKYAVIAVWVLIAVFSIPRASRVHDVLNVEGESATLTESRRAELAMRQAFAQPLTTYFAVTITSPTVVDSAPFQNALRALTTAARSRPYISTVISPLDTPDSTLIGPDRHSAFFVAAVRPEQSDTATDLVPDFRRTIRNAADRLAGSADYTVYVTGHPALDFDVRTVSKEDAERGELRALPLAAIVLVIAFGALVAAVLPLVVGVFAITVALALVQVAASVHPMSVFVLNIVTMIGLGVGIDYSLLIVTRFREELNRGLGRKDAAVRTVQTAGSAVVTSGLTVIVGFAALFMTPLSETRSVAIGGVIVVSAAVLLSITLLPAVLAWLGRNIDAPRGLARKLAWYHAPAGWERWARWLGAHPWRALVIGLVAVAAFTWPIASIKIGLPRSGWYPASTESAHGLDVLEQMGTGGVLEPIRIVIHDTTGAKVVGTRHLRDLKRLADSLEADPRIAQVRGVVTIAPGTSLLGYSLLYSDIERARDRYPALDVFLTPDGSYTRMDVLLADSTSLTGAMDVVRHARAVAHETIDDLQVLVGGFYAVSVDLQDDLLATFPLLIAVVLIITGIALFIAFRSILVPVKAVVMNCLSVVGAFGLIVLTFQNGLFGLVEGTGAIYVVVPVLVFAVVFGLSMDYEVFLLSRIKEAFDRSGKNSQATMEGLSATASVITSAALIMIIVFATFTFSRVVPVRLIGFGLAVAVLLDATLIRMILVPSFMHIAGHWNWWPGTRRSRQSLPEAREPREPRDPAS